jgi:hypothetical protein
VQTSNPVTRLGKFSGSVDMFDGTKQGCTS